MTHSAPITAPALRVERLRQNAVLPTYATHGAAGLDLSCAFEDQAPLLMVPGDVRKVPTGLRIAIPAGYEGQVRPRSGLAAHHGITVLNAPGTIDADYRGELIVLLIHHGKQRVELTDGMRIAQLVIAPVSRVEVLEQRVDSVETARGEGGFGSTGTAT